MKQDHGSASSCTPSTVDASTSRRGSWPPPCPCATAASRRPCRAVRVPAGGANEKVLDMVQEIGRTGWAAWMDKAIAEKRKVTGMGHREYKGKDPRSNVMEEYLQDSRRRRELTSSTRSRRIEKQFRERMEEKGKALLPNVDFLLRARFIRSWVYTPRSFSPPSLRWRGCPGGLPTSWSSGSMATASTGRRASYRGPEERHYLPIEERGA